MVWEKAESAAIQACNKIAFDVDKVERSLAKIGWWFILTLKVVAVFLSVYSAGYCEDRANSSDLWLSMNYISKFSMYGFVLAIVVHIIFNSN